MRRADPGPDLAQPPPAVPPLDMGRLRHAPAERQSPSPMAEDEAARTLLSSLGLADEGEDDDEDEDADVAASAAAGAGGGGEDGMRAGGGADDGDGDGLAEAEAEAEAEADGLRRRHAPAQ